MRVLVLSDSHRDIRRLFHVLDETPDIKHVFHLGDGLEEVEAAIKQYSNKTFHVVRGNNDFGFSQPFSATEILDGCRIFYTHGHHYKVKLEYECVKRAARQNKADLLLFGHTHSPLAQYEDGMHILNPGSLRGIGQPSTYGTVDITPSGIVLNIIYLK